MNIELRSKWFYDKAIKPWEPGVYEVVFAFDHRIYSYWNGSYWSTGFQDRDLTLKAPKADNQNPKCWRGLAEKPE